MSRSGYSDNLDEWSLIRWRGAVASAIRGRRGQAFLRDLRDTLDAMPTKRLIAGDLVTPSGDVCAIGAVCVARGVDVAGVDVTDRDAVGDLVGIAGALAAEIEWLNDDGYCSRRRTPEERWHAMRAWVDKQIWETTP